MPQARRPSSQRQPQRSAGRGKPPARAEAGGESRARGGSDLMARIVVAVPAAVVAIAFVDVGGTAWAVVVALLGVACLTELYSLLEEWRPISIVGFLAVAGMCLAARYGQLRDVIAVAVATLPLVFLGIVVRGESRGATLSIAGTLLGVVWIGFAFAHAVLLRETFYGKGLVIDVLVGTFASDTFAYFGGRVFGRHALAPGISPKKTWEGLGLGVIGAILAVFIAGAFQPWLPHGTALLIGAEIAILGPIGDLFESLVKRDAGAKDAGRLFGAHGGALDRLDAVSFTIVAAYYIALTIPHP